MIRLFFEKPTEELVREVLGTRRGRWHLLLHHIVIALAALPFLVIPAIFVPPIGIPLLLWLTVRHVKRWHEKVYRLTIMEKEARRQAYDRRMYEIMKATR